MFREYPRPSSGAFNCTRSLWFNRWRAAVYEKKQWTTVDLKQNIREEVAAISPNMLQRVMQNLQK
jgi:hypothetical protein